MLIKPALPILFALVALHAAQAAPAEETPVELPGLIITGVATPRPEFEVPAAIGSIDRTDLTHGQPQISLSESLTRVPGITARNRQNYAQDLQIQSRGFGARSSFGVRGLQLRLDGFPLTAPDGQGQPASLLIPALDRLEVLRGPLAFPYGNSAGGVLSAFSMEPPARTQLGARLALGADNTQHWTGSAGGSTRQSKLGYQATLGHFRSDGFREHSAVERNQALLTAGFAFDAQNHLRLLLNSFTQPTGEDPLGLTRAQFEDDPRQADAAATRFNTRKNVDDLLGGLAFEHRAGNGDRAEILGYVSAREIEQFQSIPVAVQAAPSHAGGVIDLGRDTLGLEGRYVWQWDEGALSAGLQTQTLSENRRGFENFNGAQLGVRGALRRDEDNQVQNFDQFLLGDWRVADSLRLFGALRHSEVDFESEDDFIRPGNPDDSGQRRYSAITPALALLFEADTTTRWYVSAAEGFETPTFNELSYRPDGASGLNLALDAARSRTIELGWKEQLANRGLFTAAFFHTRTEDEIVPAANSGGRASFQNAEGTRRRGVELSFDTAIAQDWSLLLAADYLDAEFSEGFSYLAGGMMQTVAAGNRLPGVARSNLFTELGWRRGLPGWSAAIEARYSDDVPVNDINSDAADDYTVVNSRLVYLRHTAWGHYSSFARIDNLLDENYAGSVIVNEGNSRFFEPAPGRTWFAGVELNFKP